MRRILVVVFNGPEIMIKDRRKLSLRTILQPGNFARYYVNLWSGYLPMRTDEWIRTTALRVLSAFPLPLGYIGKTWYPRVELNHLSDVRSIRPDPSAGAYNHAFKAIHQRPGHHSQYLIFAFGLFSQCPASRASLYSLMLNIRGTNSLTDCRSHEIIVP